MAAASLGENCCLLKIPRCAGCRPGGTPRPSRIITVYLRDANLLAHSTSRRIARLPITPRRPTAITTTLRTALPTRYIYVAHNSIRYCLCPTARTIPPINHGYLLYMLSSSSAGGVACGDDAGPHELLYQRQRVTWKNLGGGRPATRELPPWRPSAMGRTIRSTGHRDERLTFKRSEPRARYV